MATSSGLGEEAYAEHREDLTGESYRAERVRFLERTLGVLISVEDWLAIDSWLGGGKVDQHEDPDRESFSAFRAAAAVVCMSAELAEAAVQMVARNRYYAAASAIRQLIECEYLLVSFNDDLDHAKRWSRSTPDEIRNSFKPQQMRDLTGKFSNEEYWEHCSVGGHPAPKGVRLLEKMDPCRKSWPTSAAELTVDLGLHLRRIWKATDSLLLQHHARYQRVRADQRRQADEAWTAWLASDPVLEELTGNATTRIFVGGTLTSWASRSRDDSVAHCHRHPVDLA